MGARKGGALKCLQWTIRGVQFCCAAIVLAIYSYFLATLHNHGLPIPNRIRAVEGISGFAVLYTLCALVLLCFVAGRTLTSFLAMVIDVAFIGAFIYAASANRGGASSCKGDVKTAFGDGDADTRVVDDGHGGFTTLPKFGDACRLESACLAVSIVAIFFFIFSVATELALGRHHQREKRFGPGPGNDYTSGYGKKGGIFGWLRRRRTNADYENMLPEHTHPDQLPTRTSYATSTTAVGHGESAAHHNKYETGYGHGGGGDDDRLEYATYPLADYGNLDRDHHHFTHQPVAAHQPAPKPPGYRYDDGVYDVR